MEYQNIIQRSYDNTSNPPADITVTFGDGSTDSRLIATALGENNPSQELIVTSRDRTTGILLDRSRILLAQGLGSQGVDVVPAAFLQAGVGLGSGLELKARIIPKSTIGDGDIALYGGGLQWEFTQLLADSDGVSTFPLSMSLLAGYSMLNGDYDFEDGAVVSGQNQTIETKIQSINAAIIASTKFKVFNIYGALNLATGNTTTDLLGTYSFSSDSVIFPQATTFEDPISVKTSTTTVLGTLGINVTAGAFRLNADYALGQYQTASASIGFRF